MRNTLSKIVTLAMLTVPSAVTVAADSPATTPAAPTTMPATQPSAEMKILVLPFAPVQPSDPDWIGRAVQQSVVADLSRPTTGQDLQATTDASLVNTTADAIDAGKKANAKYVVFGSYQLIDPSLKLTGQVIDVSTGKVVGGLKSTGSVRELFDMEDTIAMQARYALGEQRLAEKKLPAAPVIPPAIVPQGPAVMGQGRYDNSDLSRAVADDRSLIDVHDAAGQAYRQQYYDDSYYNRYPLYGYGYNYSGFFGGYYGPQYINTCPTPRHDHDRDREIRARRLSSTDNNWSSSIFSGSSRNFSAGSVNTFSSGYIGNFNSGNSINGYNAGPRNTMQSMPRTYVSSPSQNYANAPVHGVIGHH